MNTGRNNVNDDEITPLFIDLCQRSISFTPPVSSIDLPPVTTTSTRLKKSILASTKPIVTRNKSTKLPTEPLQLPADIFIKIQRSDKTIPGKLWYVDSESGERFFQYKDQEYRSMFFLEFNNHVITRPASIPQILKQSFCKRQSILGKGWSSLWVNSEEALSNGITLEDYLPLGFRNSPRITLEQRECFALLARKEYKRPLFVTLLSEDDQDLKTRFKAFLQEHNPSLHDSHFKSEKEEEENPPLTKKRVPRSDQKELHKKKARKN